MPRFSKTIINQLRLILEPQLDSYRMLKKLALLKLTVLRTDSHIIYPGTVRQYKIYNNIMLDQIHKYERFLITNRRYPNPLVDFDKK